MRPAPSIGVVETPDSRRRYAWTYGCIVTMFMVIDKLLARLGHHDEVRAGTSDAGVLTGTAAPGTRNNFAGAPAYGYHTVACDG